MKPSRSKSTFLCSPGNPDTRRAKAEARGTQKNNVQIPWANTAGKSPIFLDTTADAKTPHRKRRGHGRAGMDEEKRLEQVLFSSFSSSSSSAGAAPAAVAALDPASLESSGREAFSHRRLHLPTPPERAGRESVGRLLRVPQTAVTSLRPRHLRQRCRPHPRR